MTEQQLKDLLGRHESGGENWSDGAADGKFLWNGYAHYRSDGKRKNRARGYEALRNQFSEQVVQQS